MVQMVVKMLFPKKCATFCIIFILISIVMATQNILLASEKNESIQKTALQEQGTLPEHKMVDMYGKEILSKDLSTWISVYTFGDRKSNDDLIEAVYPARKWILKYHPTWNMAYVNIADLVAVPTPLRYIIDPVFRKLDERGMKRLRADYKKEGIVLDESHTRYYLILDYTGDTLKVFNLKDAKRWRCYITYQSRVYAILDEDTCYFMDKFINTVKSIADKIESDKTKVKVGD